MEISFEVRGQRRPDTLRIQMRSEDMEMLALEHESSMFYGIWVGKGDICITIGLS